VSYTITNPASTSTEYEVPGVETTFTHDPATISTACDDEAYYYIVYYGGSTTLPDFIEYDTDTRTFTYT
jgi:hypothetical protein